LQLSAIRAIFAAKPANNGPNMSRGVIGSVFLR
jgi:hypothetical protein